MFVSNEKFSSCFILETDYYVHENIQNASSSTMSTNKRQWAQKTFT